MIADHQKTTDEVKQINSNWTSQSDTADIHVGLVKANAGKVERSAGNDFNEQYHSGRCRRTRMLLISSNALETAEKTVNLMLGRQNAAGPGIPLIHERLILGLQPLHKSRSPQSFAVDNCYDLVL
ncbi:hypothetical protein FHS21_005812 [Phyllobacterium trifolii]|uniref:Uncharacterized protein n=1 Tax=Phyllobacterium trifolii TaxID=300193 RepID=A0A839ULH1_9HYPH|nr:hypothetical protein [Phyllobacterium trifolii]